MLTSQGLVLATAMAVSAATIFLFDHLRRDKYFPHAPLLSGIRDFAPRKNQILLKPCLSSSDRKKTEKKKKVRFANNVKEPKGNGELYRKSHRKNNFEENNNCGNEVLEIQKMAPNRAALYSGILKDRVQRMAYSC